MEKGVCGALCIYKEGSLQFSNRDIDPILYNYLQGLRDIGRKIFGEDTSFLQIDSHFVMMQEIEDFSIICIGLSKEESKRIYEENTQLIEERIKSQL